MYSLFTNEPARAGYRLEYMEIFNWGTFDKEIYRISPAGNNSLLTGANGSGKTTYVDALLTLLVPIKKYRFYNRSSGTDKKNERTEEAYVQGASGETQEEGKQHSKTVYIRPDKKKAYSILLAGFSNEEQRPITIFQARWFYNGELKRAYGICHSKLTITKDFLPFDARGEWKKALKQQYPKKGKKDVIEFFDSGKKYADRVVTYFGMRSEKALSLFNQTVGIKVLGNLDEFIRLNMLQPQEAENEFLNLKENYNTLLQAHKQIEKATEQARLLKPVRDLAESVEETENNIKELHYLKETGTVYLNDRLLHYVSQEIEKENRSLLALEQKKQEQEEQLEEYEERKTNLAVSIEKNETGRRLKEIEREINRKEKEKNTRKSKQIKYNRLASDLELTASPDEALFIENREKALDFKSNLSEEIKGVGDHSYRVRKAADENRAEFNGLEKQVRQLRKQKNKITGRVSEIRMEILQHLGTPVKGSGKPDEVYADEIPFVGELIKVKETQKEWEAPIERLLHNFALRLLVPDKYYERVNRYVNQNNLKGRIVYHRVKNEEHYINKMLPRPGGIVLEKLDLKATIYRDWLENQLLKHYDYICVENVTEFRKYRRAITLQGLIKNKDRHQKDDRPEIISNERYVLGWDNKEKIMVLARKARELQKNIDEKEKQLKKYARQLKILEKNRENLIKLLEYEIYSEIDWPAAVKEIENLNREKKRLEETSDRIKQLQKELQAVKMQISGMQEEKDRVVQELALKRNNIFNLKKLQIEAREELKAPPFSKEQQQERFLRFENAYSREMADLSFQNFERVRKQLEKQQAALNEKLEHRKQKNLVRLSGKMLNYKNPGVEITDRFHDWRADTHKLSDDTRFADEYIAQLEKIEKEDLPSYRKKFEDYLSSTMINKIAGFKEYLDEGEEAIIENIETLNQSLQKISFKNAPSTYIQLKFPARQDVELREFKKMLREAIPDAARLHSEDSGIYKRQIFKQIQKLIDRLDKEENWRKKVIDVRNWKNYYAEEYYRENDAPMKIYKDMGKLSGGEKAQLTYTILGSAIAYQFGIRHKGLDTHSFRFIAVDETFSNQDDERATYLMDLCSQLHLQLLVVTPSDKIHIVEPYISYVHYVRRRANRESQLFDMPIKQFREKKEQVLQTTAATATVTTITNAAELEN
ncbi:MAG: AAA family ATPase [bacterium]|nr:AAA family ATPase [bacterium]